MQPAPTTLPPRQNEPGIRQQDVRHARRLQCFVRPEVAQGRVVQQRNEARNGQRRRMLRPLHEREVPLPLRKEALAVALRKCDIGLLLDGDVGGRFTIAHQRAAQPLAAEMAEARLELVALRPNHITAPRGRWGNARGARVLPLPDDHTPRDTSLPSTCVLRSDAKPDS
ncbi:hypothetical protein COLO4_00782 [Corchorus olitorius]|uniref:Uncharacterized protein n=1 Tax=Corchorus olitorius TaxID=93759 RepID=A0A1R3L3D9_9ROSI|nr:hypothetical protein COLO4_00782 [Corchorus olitorius]